MATVVFLVDVDNTLLDNDRVSADLRLHLDEAVGPEGRVRYWRSAASSATPTTSARCSATGGSSRTICAS